MASKETTKAFHSNGYRHQQQNCSSPPRKNHRRQRGRLQHSEDDKNAPRDKSSLSVTGPQKRRPRQKDSKRIPRLSPSTVPVSPENYHQNTSIEGGPNANDVVCYSIFSPKRPSGIVAIQPNSTHEGNLLFGTIVWNHAHSYKKNMALTSSSSPTSNLGYISKLEQKRLARSIAAKIHSRGGRFLVWVKQNKNLIDHSHNGCWHLVNREDVLNISRYALLKRTEAIEKGGTSYSKKRSSPITPDGKKDLARESDDSTITTAVSSDTTILHILSEFSEGSVEDDYLNLWSASPGGSAGTKSYKMPSEVACWDYKLLLPLTIE